MTSALSSVLPSAGSRKVRSIAVRGDGNAGPASKLTASHAFGPEIRIIEMAAGGRPLDKANNVGRALIDDRRFAGQACDPDLASTGNTGHLLHRLRPQFEPAFEEWRPTLHHPFDIARRQAVANQRLHPIDVDLMDGVKVWTAKKGDRKSVV